MTDIEALTEAISEKLYSKEPLAQAILLYLNKHDPSAHRQILDLFDQMVSRDLGNMINSVLENEASAKVNL